MNIDRTKIETALENDRLFVKVARSWFLARKIAAWDFEDGTWAIKVIAGPHKARGLITNIDNNAEGREFSIIGEMK